MLSEVQRENEKLRLDSGYFAKPMLAAEALIRAYPNGHDELGPLFCRFVKGVFDINAESYCDTGVPFLRILNLRNGVIDDSDLALIPEDLHQIEKKTELKRGDIVFSKTAYPAASLVTLERCNTSQDTIATTMSKYGCNTYTPEAIVAYLNSTIGQRLLWRQFQGNVQLHLSLDDGRKVPIPRLGVALQVQIKAAFSLTQKLQQMSATAFESASETLISTLKLGNWQPPTPLSYTCSSTDAFAAGRFDAEHFKPKFAELISHIENTGNAARLASLLAVNDRGNQPEYAEIGLPVVNSKHIAKNDVRLDADNRIGVASAAKVLIEPGDVLMNGTGVGTIGRSAPYLHTGKAIPDNHVTILRPKNAAVDPVYLSVFINSLGGQLQVEQRLHGSSGQIELYPTDIANFTIWLAPEAIQQEIRQAVESGFAAKQRATQLLEAAKRAVEIAIEDSEAAALNYLNEILQGAGGH